MTLSDGPYALAARIYFGRGVGSPLPVPPRAKKAPPGGYTGYQGIRPSMADVVEWATNGRGLGNVVLRLVETVIGIDVDAYGSKPGLATLEAMEAELGELPPTFVSTSRPLPSGIRFYRVPAGRVWADVVGPGIEVIHYGHRYAVVAPSIHPDTGEVYRWMLDGRVVPGPSLDDLPLLPEAWVAYLDRGDISTRSTKANISDVQAYEMLADFPRGEACPWIEKVLDEAVEALETPASRHDTVRRYVALLVRAGEQGHTGARPALTSLYQVFRDALDRGEQRLPDHGEYERMVEGAVALVLDSPTAPDDKGCCGAAVDLSGLDFDPGIADDALAHFWESREYLAHVRLYARAKMVSPWAVLGVVMARMCTRIRHEVVLPAIVGSYGSLNLYVALVGASGVGKGAAEGAAADAVHFGQEVAEASVGSGEGIGHLFRKRVKGELEWIRHSVLFSVAEVDTLAALGARQGTTLLPELRKAWSGERLGFANADPARTVPVPRHEYRLALVLGVQPLRAGGLLSDADGGTPQRFIWLPALDPGIPDAADTPAEPPAWTWPGLADPLLWNTRGLAEMIVPEVARTEIVSTRIATMRGTGDPLDGHKLQAQLKVAAILALLDSRWEITGEDWNLATTIMLVSTRTREKVQATIAKAATERDHARAVAEGDREVVKIERVEGAVASRCREKVLAMLSETEETPYRELHNRVSKEQRGHLDPVLGELLGNGEIVKNDGGDREWFKLAKR